MVISLIFLNTSNIIGTYYFKLRKGFNFESKVATIFYVKYFKQPVTNLTNWFPELRQQLIQSSNIILKWFIRD